MSKTGRNWTAIIAVVLAVFVAVNIISYVWMPFLPWFEQRQAGEKIIKQEMDAEQALQDYRWFRQQYHDIEAQRQQIQNYYDQEAQFHETWGDDPSSWTRSAQTRHGRIHDRITGSKNMLENMVAEYNAKSDDATSAIWKCSLPYQVDERFAIQGPPGSGAPETPSDQYVDGADPNQSPPKAEQCDGLPKEVRQEANS
jgi:hypothetical protein